VLLRAVNNSGAAMPVGTENALRCTGCNTCTCVADGMRVHGVGLKIPAPSPLVFASDWTRSPALPTAGAFKLDKLTF
jgi:hypothetical protein